MCPRLILFTVLVAFIVVILGAYVRLSNAGLGCPDWPGCYGQLFPRITDEGQGTLPSEAYLVKRISPKKALHASRFTLHGEEVNSLQSKALKEMIHRYAAGTLGALILVLALTLRTPLSFFLLGLVVFQAALGMWTVTLKLHPFIVMAHLLGGFATLGLLWWLYLTTENHNPSQPPLILRGGVQSPPLGIRGASRETWAGRPKANCALFPALLRFAHQARGELRLPVTALLVLILQIALGGWMSANYASVACPDFPKCHGEWLPPMDFKEAFLVWRDIGINYEWGVLENTPRVTIHMMHRLGAVITFVVLLIPAVRCLKRKENPFLQKLGVALLALLTTQVGLGILNVVLHLPLAVAVVHHAVAAILLLVLITLKSLLQSWYCQDSPPAAHPVR